MGENACVSIVTRIKEVDVSMVTRYPHAPNSVAPSNRDRMGARDRWEVL